ncbi:MAG: hypothetical protein RR712_03130 [Terrisporobacter sp.]|uniref:hypothetical protein n=1 Tax=Terrisporobacter sp. TaxID=1965305 RepID=UPI002FC7EAC0
MYNINRLNLIKVDMDDCIYKLERFTDNYNLIKGNSELEQYLQSISSTEPRNKINFYIKIDTIKIKNTIYN